MLVSGIVVILTAQHKHNTQYTYTHSTILYTYNTKHLFTAQLSLFTAQHTLTAQNTIIYTLKH